jgi:DNA-binding transcriptional ArsR family regulator
MVKEERDYISLTSKAVAHPVRQKILHSLKESAKSTTKLEEELGENRYNLYHHLEILVDADLIEKKVGVNKEKDGGKRLQRRPQFHLKEMPTCPFCEKELGEPDFGTHKLTPIRTRFINESLTGEELD